MKNSKPIIILIGVAIALLATYHTFAQETKHYKHDLTKIALNEAPIEEAVKTVAKNEK